MGLCLQILPLSPYPHPHAQGWIHGGHIDEYDVHPASFTRASLTTLLRRAGFRDVKEFAPWHDDTSHFPLSLNLEATKRVNKIAKVPHIAKKCIFLVLGAVLGETRADQI